MTSVSPVKTTVNVLFFRDAPEIYGPKGLIPATVHSAGLDLRACPEQDKHILIPPGERRAIPSGIAVETTAPGIAGFVYSRSGLGAVKGLTVAQGVGLIDPDYRGEIMVYLLNTSSETHSVRRGDRIAQLVFQPYVQASFQVVDELGRTERGSGGFGHTGAR